MSIQTRKALADIDLFAQPAQGGARRPQPAGHDVHHESRTAGRSLRARRISACRSFLEGTAEITVNGRAAPGTWLRGTTSARSR